MDDFGKIIAATGFEKLPKLQLIAQSGHTGSRPLDCQIFFNHSFSFLSKSSSKFHKKIKICPKGFFSAPSWSHVVAEETVEPGSMTLTPSTLSHDVNRSLITFSIGSVGLISNDISMFFL